MAGVDYCTVLPSWEFNKDPACVVSYLFDSIDGLLEADAPDNVPHNIVPDCCLMLECSSNEQLTGDQRESCTLSIACKPQYRVSVLGIDIISQSKSLEVYDTCEGYVMTVRGSRVPCVDGEGGEDQNEIFNCRVRLKETMYGFTVKFPSTSNMRRFNIYNIVLILNPEADTENDVEDGVTFNMDKVKSFIDTDSMSPGALDLMRSVEQYQQNKKNSLSGLQGLLSQTSQGSSGHGMAGLMGLMSMFTNMSSDSQTLNRPVPNGPNVREPSASRTSQSASLPRTCNQGDGSDETGVRSNGSNMYHLLQNICGEVTKMRAVGLEEVHEDKDEEQSNDTQCHEGDAERLASEDLEDQRTRGDTTGKVMKTCIDEMELRLQAHIDQRLSEIEHKLEAKLDKILETLLTVCNNTSPKPTDKDSGENS